VAFSPSGGATAAVVAAINEARHTVHLAAYRFTSRPIAEALVTIHARGVEVAVVLDRGNATGPDSLATFLADRQVPVRLDTRVAVMHDKFLVVDGLSVETGSFNYTRAAEEQNAENVIILRDSPDVAAPYEREWQRLWAESQDHVASEGP
jgi:phosphatidylserine/phosphatidylglycerophosphate/cardiolipin synthase-like enzyme